jgi:outer membrane protein
VRWFIATAIAALASLTTHAEVDEVVRQARDALAQGQAKRAFELLAAKEVERAGDPDFDLALGMAANRIAQYSRAILALERAVSVQPGNAQARGELGRALLAVGDRVGARSLLAESRVQGIPLVAGESIDQLLQAVDRVDASGQSSYKAYIDLTLGHDSNANGGPAVRNLAVPAFGGALVALQPAGIRTGAGFLGAGGGISGRYVIDSRWSAIGNGTAGGRRHSEAGRPFDYAQADANAGVSWRAERHELTLVAQLGAYDIDGARVRNTKGAVAEWTYRFDGFRQASVYGQFGRVAYPQQPIADVDRGVAGATYAQLARTGLFGYGGVYAGREAERASGVAHLGHALKGWRGGLQQPLNPALATFLTLAQEHRRFGGQDPLFLAARRDRQLDVSVGLSWVPAPSWRVTPQAAWTRTRSTVPTADFDRRIASIAVRREF